MYLSQKDVVTTLKMNPQLDPLHANLWANYPPAVLLNDRGKEPASLISVIHLHLHSKLFCSCSLVAFMDKHTQIWQRISPSTTKPHLLYTILHHIITQESVCHTHTHINSNVHSHPSLPISADLAHQSS